MNIVDSLLRSDYMPHGHCYWWKPEILWLNVTSDFLIAFAYFSIPFALYYFVKKRTDLRFKGIFLLFSAFILLCGVTHLISIVVIWKGYYGVHGLAKLVTAIISCITAYKVYQSIPAALTLPSAAQVREVYQRANEEKLERARLQNQREQEQILRESTDSAHVGILVVNASGHITVANRAICQIFEYEHQELEGKHINILVDEGFAQAHEKLVQQFIASTDNNKDMASDRIVYGVAKSGRRIPIEVRLNHQTYQQQPVVFVSLQDISARIRSEQAREQSETMTRSIIHSLPIGLHIFELKDKELRFVSANPRAQQILKSPQHSTILQRHTIENVFPALKSDTTTARFIRVATHGESILHEDIYFDNGAVSGVFQVSAFQSSPGKVIVLFDDVTEQRRAEQALRKQDTFIHRAINASIAAVYVFDTGLRTNRYINERYTTITGYTLPALKAQSKGSLITLIHPEDRFKVLAHVKQLLTDNTDGAIHTIEYRMRHAEGHWIWLMAQNIAFERDLNGNITQFMGSFLDISPLKKMQNNLLEMKDKAENANQAKGEFLANMSHEIRTPMNAITVLTDMILEMELGIKQREYLEKIAMSSKSLLQILNDILDYSKLEAGKLDVVNDTFDLFKTVSGGMKLFAINAVQKGLELHTDISSNTPRFVVGDSVRISQILNNLIGNAIKFTESGSVVVSVDAEAGRRPHSHLIKIAVKDTGIGIASDKLGTLFESFTQADSAIDRRYGGTGLGLSICKSLTELLGGNLSVTSQPGKGSTFTLSLTLHEDASVCHEMPDLPRSLNVVLVGDTSQSASIMQKYLSDHLSGGFTLFSHDQFSLTTLNDCDILIIDITQLAGASLRDMMLQLVSAELSEKVSKGTLFICNESARQSADASVIISTPSFRLATPFSPADIDEMLIAIASETSQSVAKKLYIPQFQDCQVLLVEDNPTNQYVAEELLRSTGLKLTVAADGEAALALFTEKTYDLVLMDLQMPKLDGFATTIRLRNLPGGSEIPIYAMSAAAMDGDIRKVAETGMKGHIAKPIDRQKLYNILETELAHKLIKRDFALSELETPPVSAIDIQRALPALNATDAINRLGGNTGSYLRLLHSVASEYAEVKDNAGAFPASDTPVARAIHTLKGLAASIGANRLSALCKEYEASESPTDKQLGLNRIRQQLADVVSAIFTAMPSLHAPQLQDALAHATDLDVLKTQLEKRAYISQENLLTYEAALTEKFGRERAQRISDSIHALRYEEAVALLAASDANTRQ
ncbi:PAS domain S-box protein [Alteromonas sp. H39]|uniref:PAS domain S-box protein n=1 Tax=Alteromonas sp. H39 TaxID=3389876 RepID=UPI0039E035A6